MYGVAATDEDLPPKGAAARNGGLGHITHGWLDAMTVTDAKWMIAKRLQLRCSQQTCSSQQANNNFVTHGLT